jgi:hypothetical protein
MTRWASLLFLAVGATVIALTVKLVQPESTWVALVMIGGAIAAGELIELRPPMRTALPISFAFMVVLAQRASVGEAAIVLVAAELAALVVRSKPTSIGGRLVLFAERMAEGMATVLVYQALSDSVRSSSRGRELLVLGVSAVAPIVVAEVARMIRERKFAIPTHGRLADLGLVTSATLMAISDQGVQGKGGMGLWGPAVFTIPLLAAWYSYEHLETIRRTYDQTIRALGAAPEMGGLVREGHAERVAALTVAIAGERGFSRHELDQLETAALLHHLGQVCLDEPEDGRRPEAVAIAEAGATILRSTELLAPAGDIIASEWLPYRANVSSRPSVMSGQILKVASAFDELSEGRPERAGLALEALYSAPGYLYDGTVLRSLEIVLDRRGLLEPAS